MTTSKFHLNMLFVFFSIRRIDFSLFSCDKMFKAVRRNLLSLSLRVLHELVERSGKLITVADSEDSLENINIVSNSKILPGVIIRKLTYNFRNLLSFKEDSLRYSWINYLGFSDVDSVIW